MKPIYLQTVVWACFTLIYFVSRDFIGLRIDLLQAIYFVAGAFPSAIVYRSASFDLFGDWLKTRRIDSSSLQIRLFGTVSPVFLSTLFSSAETSLTQKNLRFVRVQFLLTVLLFGLSIAVINLT
jgi:hypothetical protein